MNCEKDYWYSENEWVPMDKCFPETYDINSKIEDATPLMITFISPFNGKPYVLEQFVVFCDDGSVRFYENCKGEISELSTFPKRTKITAWRSLVKPYIEE